VLEHIPNDRAALIELLRILRPSGTAYLTVPMADGWRHTFEDVSISTEEERLRHFGQGDHVRWYGRDFPERLSAVGFIVDEFRPPYRDYAEYGLAPGDVVFIARKNKSS
jgi:SAM-dependent methyltransferase